MARDECPELKKFATRILGLTCSSSGCERNWCAFEMVHIKKRNRLHAQKMNDLVFVMYNLKLKQKQLKRASKYQPPVVPVLDDLSSDDEWITEIEDPVLPEDGAWLNVLDRAARRAAKEASNIMPGNEEEINQSQNAGVEQLVISDDENDVAACVASNEVHDSGNLETDFGDGDGDDYDYDDLNVTGTGTSGALNDFIDDGNFCYDEN
ncbi:uncharacterized protein [Spinacia oleracea]|uniref:Uncharacterized protein isoform X2 n=1 Tax=Spinacia oleracea TaxID=3562 RepID=A0ABM3QMK9_SPIOL|nr:uncharacterized protein LOC110786155 isoform X2 [Spinacia oleracea]XP_056684600.1 uncharacterized protein LOC110786155 isoform X2 [Spinacia oleracea]